MAPKAPNFIILWFSSNIEIGKQIIFQWKEIISYFVVFRANYPQTLLVVFLMDQTEVKYLPACHHPRLSVLLCLTVLPGLALVYVRPIRSSSEKVTGEDDVSSEIKEIKQSRTFIKEEGRVWGRKIGLKYFHVSKAHSGTTGECLSCFKQLKNRFSPPTGHVKSPNLHNLVKLL